MFTQTYHRVLDWLKAFAKERDLRWRQDGEGNMVILRPGTAGGETAPPVIVQVSFFLSDMGIASLSPSAAG